VFFRNEKYFHYLWEVILFNEKFHDVWHKPGGVANNKDNDHHHRCSTNDKLINQQNLSLFCVFLNLVYFASLFFNSCSFTPATLRKLFGFAVAEHELPEYQNKSIL